MASSNLTQLSRSNMVSDCMYGLTELSCFRVCVLGDGDAIIADLSSVCSADISSGDLTSPGALGFWKRSRGIVISAGETAANLWVG